MQHRRPLPPRSVLITIDDGYRSVYEIAYPILREFDFSAVLFIYTELIDVSPIALTWNQLAEMRRNGFAVGSHTIRHSDLTLPREGESEAPSSRPGWKTSWSGPSRSWTAAWGRTPGSWPTRTATTTRKWLPRLSGAGYKLAMSVKRGGNPFFANPFTLKRDQILERDLPTFVKRLKTFNSLPLE